MKGKLKVMKGYTPRDHLSPMGLVGEIGVFTSGKRTADVLAQTESNGDTHPTRMSFSVS